VFPFDKDQEQVEAGEQQRAYKLHVLLKDSVRAADLLRDQYEGQEIAQQSCHEPLSVLAGEGNARSDFVVGQYHQPERPCIFSRLGCIFRF
jgi:hypothetical protein